MNIRAEIPPAVLGGNPATAIVVPLPSGRRRPLAEGFLAPVGDRACALFFDAPSTATLAGGPRPRLAVEVDGVPVAGPLVSTALPLQSGGCRHLVLVGHGAEWLLRRRVTVALGAAPAALLDPEWLQSPRVDLAAAFEGLTEDGRQRLLRLFITTGASLLGRGGAGFAVAARDLLALLGVRRLAPLGWCGAGATARVVSYRLPHGVDPDRLGPLTALAGAAMARVAGSPMMVEPRREGALLHVLVTGALPQETVLVAAGPAPLALALPADTAPVAIERWLAARDTATRDWCGRLIDGAAPGDPVARAILRELRHCRDVAPSLAVDHLSATPAGILHALRLADPHGLVRAVRVARGGATATVAVEDGLAGYVALPRVSPVDDRYRLALVLHSGRVMPVAAGALPAYDGAAPVAAPPEAVAAARVDRERTGRVLRVEAFGEGGALPSLSMIAPVPACPDIVATRAAMAAAEGGGGAVEILYHATEGDGTAARAILARAAATFAIPHRLLVVTPDLDAGARAAAAVAAANAPTVLLLGAEVLPAGPGWLAPWRRLSRRHPMLRATLEGYDGRRQSDAAGCVGFLREAVLDVLAAAAPCGVPVLAAEAAAVLARRGTPEARVGVVFRRYGGEARTGFEAAVDAAALALVLKRSFSIACDEGQP